jgi:hypothetical protein
MAAQLRTPLPNVAASRVADPLQDVAGPDGKNAKLLVETGHALLYARLTTLSERLNTSQRGKRVLAATR